MFDSKVFKLDFFIEMILEYPLTYCSLKKEV